MKPSKNYFSILAIIAMFVVPLACLGSTATSTPVIIVVTATFPENSIQAPVNTPQPTNTIQPTNTPIPPTPTPNPNLIKAGTYLVGTQIKPGIYMGVAAQGVSCSWERLKGTSGSPEDIIANDTGIGQYYVRVKAGDYAFKTECDMTWLESVKVVSSDFPRKNIGPGTYILGADIQAGLYKGTAVQGEACYWERLKGLDDTPGNIITFDNSEGQYYVQVKKKDFAFQTECDMTLLEPPLAPSSDFPMTIIGPGTYLIGIDIQAGTYQGQAGKGESCYWERLKGVSGTSGEIIASDNSEGQYSVEVAPSDFALHTACELELVR